MTHTSTEQQSETLRLASRLEHRSMSGVQPNDLAASAELRRLHARVQELEASQAQRTPLSDAEICDALGIDGSDEWTYTVARAVEAAHGITHEKQQ